MKLGEHVEILQGNCTQLLQQLPDESVDAFITDPPYLYLKNQKLDKPFDETIFFNEAKRALKASGFIVMFGRGTSFYRWNTILADLGFVFKEEVVWNKVHTSSPVLPVNRIHETISIHTKLKGTIKKTRVPYTTIRQYDIKAIENDIKTLKRVLKNHKVFQEVESYLKTNKIALTQKYKSFDTTVMCNYLKSGSREAYIMMNLKEGLREKSIIMLPNTHKGKNHPTQKPVRLIERLIPLVTQEGALVVDPFMGSGTTGIACINTGRRFIGMELDDEYFGMARGRIESAIKQNECSHKDM